MNLNNRPVTYIEDDIQYPILTPNSILFGQDTVILEEDPVKEGNRDSWKKHQKYIVIYKDAAWR